MENSLSEKDLAQLKEKGISLDLFQKQLAHFRNGFPYANLDRPATPGDGIKQLSTADLVDFVAKYETLSERKAIIKFVPASGAATRMFKDLHNFRSEQSINAQPAIQTFKAGLNNFAFLPELEKAMGQSLSALEDDAVAEVIQALLDASGLDYANLPKALIKFHAYPEGNRTSLAEHLVEAANHLPHANGLVQLHFTVSEGHISRIKNLLGKVVPQFENQFGIQYQIDLSTQKSGTDTLAVDLDNQPFRLEDGSLLFRPGGHGALLENLNELEGDVVFLKNIDNVQHDRLKQDTFLYKKAMGGVLLHLQQKIFGFLPQLENGTFPEGIQAFLAEELGWRNVPNNPAELYTMLNRPIRICGMVKNEGEPGGGPFWVKNDRDQNTLQIVEKAQIDPEETSQQKILQGATHFNPVDLVCSLRNHKDDDFDLLDFRDPNTGFISEKSLGGKSLKALELPGLWNGAMANWITLFVEVPLRTFSPVKTVNDLLKTPHQP